MPGNDDHGDRKQNRTWQPDQRGERNHADPDGPDHLQIDHGGRELERPGKVHEGDFQQHQNQSPLEQEGRRIVFALMLFCEQVSG
ncbi:hypothetical protein D3C76_1110400 [compost metagenome]